jgi:hypothetical protein
LLDAATGKVQAEPLPKKAKKPVLQKITPPAGPRGQGLRLKLEGQHLSEISEVVPPVPGFKSSIAAGTPGSVEIAVTFPPTTPAGVYQLGVKNAAGASATVPLIVDLFPAVSKADGNDSPRTAQKVTLPATLVGAIQRAGEVDFFRFEAGAGQEIGVQAITGPLGSTLEPVLQLLDPAGNGLAESANGLLGYTCPKAGSYVLCIRDREFRGDAKMIYRLHVGPVSIVTGVFPLGMQRGTEAEIRLEGVHLTGHAAHVMAPAEAAVGSRLPVPAASPHGAPLGDATIVVGEYPEVVATDKQLSLPSTANGRITEPGRADVWRFPAKKGQRLIVEVHARRLGSPLDSMIEILDAAGRPLPLATLRSLARTNVTFRDHDASGTGIRIETWSELAINDYLLVGGELIRIRELPRNPDDDCQFFGAAGRRLGFLGTTPTHHPQGQPMYKVAIHPPGAKFPPNGLPVITLYHRNDDGGPGYDKDSMLFFDPPADGEYRVRIADARGQGGPLYAYRLTVRPPRPSYTVSFAPTAPAVGQGDGVSVNVTAERTDGFHGPIEVRLENLPPGFTAPPTTILPDDNSTSFTLFAEPGATVPAGGAPIKLVARAVIDGKEVVREVAGGSPRLVKGGDIATTTDQTEVRIQPGAQARLTVRIDRREGFKGRVPLDVKGLPHGVRVLDIGLNGILVTERDTSRVVVLYAEPWVKLTAHPIVVLARSERKNTEHAARSVLLRVADR